MEARIVPSSVVGGPILVTLVEVHKTSRDYAWNKYQAAYDSHCNSHELVVVWMDIPSEKLNDFEAEVGCDQKDNDADDDVSDVHHQPINAEVPLGR